MKLFSTYNRISISASILVFLAGCTAFYVVLRFILIHQIDQTLETEREEIIEYVNEHNQLPEIPNTSGQIIVYKPVAQPVRTTLYASRKIWNSTEGEQEWIRRLRFGIIAAGKSYTVEVSKSQVEAEDLLQIILVIAASMIALILLAGYIINRVVIQRLWKPFYHTIGQVGHYRLPDQQSSLALPEVEIEEFNLLNKSLNQMIDKAQGDYKALKDFTGNAAHEMQTPLAVIRTHVDTLAQDEHLLRLQGGPIKQIEQAVSRLSRLNGSLLLLTKIENQQFPLNEEVQLDQVVQEKTSELSELILLQQVVLLVEVVPVKIHFHRFLAETLIANLLYNAIRYNKKGGCINICLRPDCLLFSNSSELPALDKEKVFQRFYRHPQTKASGNGLGLSIVYQICEMASYRITYSYSNQMHRFVVVF